MRAMRDLPVVPICRNPTPLPVAPNQWHLAPSRTPQEGRFAIVTKRWARDAMDASAQKANELEADGEVVWCQRRRFEVPA
jgi:hypothetical protein